MSNRLFFSVSRIISDVLNMLATRNFSPPSIFGREPERLRGIYRAFFLAKKLKVHSFIFVAKRQLCLAILKKILRVTEFACHSSGYFDNYIRWNFANCAKRSAPLETERFARESLWICKTTPRYQKISSPSPAGAMKIFLWIRYKRIFFFIARDISWKEIPLFLAPTVFHSGNQGAPAPSQEQEKKNFTVSPKFGMQKKQWAQYVS